MIADFVVNRDRSYPRLLRACDDMLQRPEVISEIAPTRDAFTAHVQVLLLSELRTVHLCSAVNAFRWY